MYKIALLLACYFMTSCCSVKTNKRIETSLDTIRIEFGNGGGFAGVLNQFSVLKNGQCFKVEGTKSKTFSPIEEACAFKAKRLYKKCTKLDLTTAPFQHPGNMYYFIKYYDGNEVQVITWGDINFPVNEKVQKLYDELMKLTLKEDKEASSKK